MHLSNVCPLPPFDCSLFALFSVAHHGPSPIPVSRIEVPEGRKASGVWSHFIVGPTWELFGGTDGGRINKLG